MVTPETGPDLHSPSQRGSALVQEIGDTSVPFSTGIDTMLGQAAPAKATALSAHSHPSTSMMSLTRCRVCLHPRALFPAAGIFGPMQSVRVSRHVVGAALVATSAAAFGSMAILGVWAHEDGTGTWPLLMLRFGIAAILLLAIVRVREIELPAPRRVVALAAMGGIGYVGQSYCYFMALQYADASTVALLLYLYPALVAVLAAVFLKERLTSAVVASLVLSLAGTSLVVGAGTGEVKGIALAVGAALIYSVYITVGSRVIQDVHPLMVALVVCTAAATVCAGAVLIGVVRGGEVQLPESATGWVATTMIAVVCTVVAIVTFFAGMQLLGPTRTAVLSTLEPVVTAVLAVTLLSEILSLTQVVGGVMVIAAVMWQATQSHPGRVLPQPEDISKPTTRVTS